MRKIRPSGKLDTMGKRVDEIEYLLMRICETLKISTKYT